MVFNATLNNNSVISSHTFIIVLYEFSLNDHRKNIFFRRIQYSGFLWFLIKKSFFVIFIFDITHYSFY